ncbi:hypothetical protein KCU95_g9687, partial [Aureobasidium melanogenum]
MHEGFRSPGSTSYATLEAIQELEAWFDSQDQTKTTSMASAGSGSYVIPETPPSSDTETVPLIVEQDNSKTDVLEVGPWTAASHSPQNTMHASFRAPSSDPRMEPLRLDSSSTEVRSQTGKPITSHRPSVRCSIGKGAAPPPRFNNPEKIAKSKVKERGTASYLNQQQLYMPCQQENRVVRKLETKSIPQLQLLQHKAQTIHASNKIKNLIQNALFEKHMAEMKEGEGKVDVWSQDGRDKEDNKNRWPGHIRNSISNLTSSLSSFDLSSLLSPLAFAKKMEYFKPFGDVVIHTVEESDDDTLTSETNQVNTAVHVKVKRESPQLPDIGRGTSRPRRSLSQMRKERTNHPLVTRLTAGQNVAYTDKLDRIKKKLEKKTVEELTDLYNGSEDSSFREIIMEVFHEKRMATLEDWEKQIGDIEVLVFKNFGGANNTTNTTAVNTNNGQSNISTIRRARSARRSIKRSSPVVHSNSSMAESPSGRVTEMTTTSPIAERYINEDLVTLESVRMMNFKEELENAAEYAARSTTPDSLIAHTSRSTTPTQTNTVNHNTASKASNHTSSSRVSKSNPSHIALFDTLSPSQSLGRKRKLTSIRNKLKQKTCEELHEIYNSTDDPDFRKLMSEVYYENCMERLDDWERKL